MKVKLTVLLISLFLVFTPTRPEGWELFENVVFSATYFEEVDSYFEVPTFDPELLAHEKKEVTLSGYFVPIGVDTIFVISANPYSACFFCGMAGPETVAEVRMPEIPSRLEPDAFVKVKGKLKLNDKDIDYMNFILQDAEFVK